MSFNICRGTLGSLAMLTRSARRSFPQRVLGGKLADIEQHKHDHSNAGGQCSVVPASGGLVIRG